MNIATRALLALLVGSFIGGCASMPNLEASYYHPRLDAEFVVLQTASCTAGDVPVATFEVLPKEVFSRDEAREKETINFSWFGNLVSKGDLTIEYYADGRLKSISSVQAGQGTAALQSLVKLAATFVIAQEPSPDLKKACASLRTLAGESKTLTIKYFGATEFKAELLQKDDPKSYTVTPIALKQLTLSIDQLNSVSAIFGSVTATFEPKKTEGATNIVERDSEHYLNLIQPAETNVTIKVRLAGEDLEWIRTFHVPQLGDNYELPLQKSPWFGENKFSVALNESGTLQKLQYAGDSDAAGVVTTLGEVRGALDETTAEKLAGLKNESDLIVEQQRWARCQADPTTCQ